jgi:hypothetical protein
LRKDSPLETMSSAPFGLSRPGGSGSHTIDIDRSMRRNHPPLLLSNPFIAHNSKERTAAADPQFN